MTDMQKFTYHTHNNSQGIFDGSSGAEEMVAKAEELGFEEIGVSNHLIIHPNMPQDNHPMFFNNAATALDVYKKSYDEIDEAAARHKIKVLKGFEVDFFASKEWRNTFEKLIAELKPDYLIGATHFICAPDESFMCNIYHLNTLPQDFSQEALEECLRTYWHNTKEAINSGYFDFIAHFDYCTQFNLCTTPEWADAKWQIIEALSSKKQAFEINAGGIAKIGRPFPDWWMIKELLKRDVPTLISDDSHHISQIGRHFAEVESFLSENGCKHRFKLSK